MPRRPRDSDGCGEHTPRTAPPGFVNLRFGKGRVTPDGPGFVCPSLARSITAKLIVQKSNTELVRISALSSHYLCIFTVPN